MTGESLFRQATWHATLLHPFLYVIDFKRSLNFGEAQAILHSNSRTFRADRNGKLAFESCGLMASEIRCWKSKMRPLGNSPRTGIGSRTATKVADNSVTSFPGPGSRIAISSAGGSDARWRGDGQQLFYISDNLTIVSVDVRESAKEFRVLSSKPLFRLQLPWNVGFYDVTRDGTRFLVNTRTLNEQSTPPTVLTNWPLQLQSNP